MGIDVFEPPLYKSFICKYVSSYVGKEVIQRQSIRLHPPDTLLIADGNWNLAQDPGFIPLSDIDVVSGVLITQHERVPLSRLHGSIPF